MFPACFLLPEHHAVTTTTFYHSSSWDTQILYTPFYHALPPYLATCAFCTVRLFLPHLLLSSTPACTHTPSTASILFPVYRLFSFCIPSAVYHLIPLSRSGLPGHPFFYTTATTYLICWDGRLFLPPTRLLPPPFVVHTTCRSPYTPPHSPSLPPHTTVLHLHTLDVPILCFFPLHTLLPAHLLYLFLPRIYTYPTHTLRWWECLHFVHLPRYYSATTTSPTILLPPPPTVCLHAITYPMSVCSPYTPDSYLPVLPATTVLMVDAMTHSHPLPGISHVPVLYSFIALLAQLFGTVTGWLVGTGWRWTRHVPATCLYTPC